MRLLLMMPFPKNNMPRVLFFFDLTNAIEAEFWEVELVVTVILDDKLEFTYPDVEIDEYMVEFNTESLNDIEESSTYDAHITSLICKGTKESS